MGPTQKNNLSLFLSLFSLWFTQISPPPHIHSAAATVPETATTGGPYAGRHRVGPATPRAPHALPSPCRTGDTKATPRAVPIPDPHHHGVSPCDRTAAARRAKPDVAEARLGHRGRRAVHEQKELGRGRARRPRPKVAAIAGGAGPCEVEATPGVDEREARRAPPRPPYMSRAEPDPRVLHDDESLAADLDQRRRRRSPRR